MSDDSTTTRRRLLIGLGTGATIAVAGCSGGGDGGSTPTETPTQTRTGTPTQMTTETPMGTGNVRFAHMSPNAPNVDVYVDDDRVLSDVSFRTVSDYLELPVGEHTITITPTGEPDTTVFEDDVTVDAGDHTITAIGELGGGTSVFQIRVLEDNNSDVGDDTARVRVVHTSPDLGAVDIATADGDVLVEEATFGDAAYVEVPAGQYALQVQDSDSNYVAGEFSVEFTGGTVYTAYVVGYREPGMSPMDVAPILDLELSVDAGEAAS